MGNTTKVLYALLYERLDSSIDNGWVNEDGEVYVIFTRADMREALNLSDNTITNAMNALKEHGLIEERRGGPGEPNRIYFTQIE